MLLLFQISLKKQKIFSLLFSRLLRSSRTNVFQFFQRPICVVNTLSISDTVCQMVALTHPCVRDISASMHVVALTHPCVRDMTYRGVLMPRWQDANERRVLPCTSRQTYATNKTDTYHSNIKKPEQVGLLCPWMDGMSQRARDGGVTFYICYYLLAMASSCLALIICPLRPDSLPFLP